MSGNETFGFGDDEGSGEPLEVLGTASKMKPAERERSERVLGKIGITQSTGEGDDPYARNQFLQLTRLLGPEETAALVGKVEAHLASGGEFTGALDGERSRALPQAMRLALERVQSGAKLGVNSETLATVVALYYKTGEPAILDRFAEQNNPAPEHRVEGFLYGRAAIDALIGEVERAFPK